MTGDNGPAPEAFVAGEQLASLVVAHVNVLANGGIDRHLAEHMGIQYHQMLMTQLVIRLIADAGAEKQGPSSPALSSLLDKFLADLGDAPRDDHRDDDGDEL